MIDKDSWSLTIEENSPDYDDKLDQLLLESHTPPCVQSIDFCKPGLKHPYTIVWFPEGTCFYFLYLTLLDERLN